MAHELFKELVEKGYTFFTGVPDSGLKDFQDALIYSGYSHVVATNEGQAVALAFGAELAGQKACVYMQNSGLDNAINPITSLCIPCGIEPFLVIGHRHTLPQHKVMGEIDEELMSLTGYTNYRIVNGGNNEK